MNQQQQMRLVLLHSLKELSGGAKRSDVLQHIQNLGYWSKNDENDISPPTRKEKSWRNNFSYERQHLVEQGYMNPGGGGTWQITDLGERYLFSLMEQIRETDQSENAHFTPAFLRAVFAEQTFAEKQEEQRLLASLCLQKEADPSENVIVLSDAPEDKKPALKHTDGRNVYPRAVSVANRALSMANHRCEIDFSHPSFIRRSDNTLYMEPHHLVPMSMTDYFGVNLDREQNIFSLCSNCHNQIHYGIKEDVRRLLSQLFLSREQEICSILGQKITPALLYEIYKVL